MTQSVDKKHGRMVAHAFNPSTWEAEAGGSLWFWSYPGLQSEFQDRLQSYLEPYLEKNELI